MVRADPFDQLFEAAIVDVSLPPFFNGITIKVLSTASAQGSGKISGIGGKGAYFAT